MHRYQSQTQTTVTSTLTNMVFCKIGINRVISTTLTVKTREFSQQIVLFYTGMI